jgi:lysophosphatidylcholine acyltransferase/lyso-PAF acetyltransferase
MIKHKSNILIDWPPNPFVNNIIIDESKEKIKIVFMSVFVAPVRLMLMSFCLGMAYFAALATLFELDVVQTPLKGLRRKSKDLVANFVIWAHVIAGFQVKIKGKRASPFEAPILVLAPHSSFYDALAYCSIGAPSIVGKKSLFDAPIVGKLLKVTFPVMVDRDRKDSRKETIEKIKERTRQLLAAKDTPDAFAWSQIAIFAEGTTTNRTSLITFKPGAFYPQLPVQPVCLKWTSAKPPLDHVTWTWDGAGVFQLLWLTCCKLKKDLEIEFLPVHRPSEAEKCDATLFARNVRREMAKCLGLPTSEYSLEDAQYLSSSIVPSVEKISQLYNSLKPSSTSEDGENLIGEWRKWKNSEWQLNSYRVTIDEFAKFLNVEFCSSLQRVFNSFDWMCTGAIDLREFIITKHANEAKNLAFLKTCYQMFAEDNTIAENDFIKILRFPYGFSLKCCREIYARLIKSSDDGRVSFDAVLKIVNERGTCLKDFNCNDRKS